MASTLMTYLKVKPQMKPVVAQREIQSFLEFEERTCCPRHHWCMITPEKFHISDTKLLSANAVSTKSETSLDLRNKLEMEPLQKNVLNSVRS